jgi:hypothetical protein
LKGCGNQPTAATLAKKYSAILCAHQKLNIFLRKKSWLKESALIPKQAGKEKENPFPKAVARIPTMVI